MFNKEKSSKIKSISNINFKYFKKIGAIILTTLLLSPVNSLATGLKSTGSSDFDIRQNEYINKVMQLKEEDSFDNDLVDIYYFYDFEIDGKIINVSRVYLAYGYDENNNLVMYIVAPSLGNYDVINNEKYSLHNTMLAQLRQTTLFIDLLRNDLIEVDEDSRILRFSNKRNEINSFVENWDGTIHELVPETAAFDEKVIMKR